MTGSTVGPWRPVGSTVLDAEGRVVALVYGQPGAGVEAGLEQARRDARLMAAAPDLLAALEEVRGQFFGDDDAGWKRRMRDTVDDAITRATGGAS